MKNKYQRTMVANSYEITDLNWIKEQIVLISNLNPDDIERKLIITKIKDSYGDIGTIFFSLNGSPPRGFALYNAARYSNSSICFINRNLSINKTYKNTFIKDITLTKFLILQGLEK